MIAERTLAQAAHAWGAQAVPFSDQPKSELFRTASLDQATALLNQSAALRSVMLLSGENGVGKSALAGRWLRSLEPKAYFPLCITQASLTGIGVLAFFLQKLGKAAKHQRSTNLKLLEEAFVELGRTIPVLLLDEAQNYDISALEEIRMLLGLNLPEQPAFALVLVGDPYLLSALRLRSHRALYSLAEDCTTTFARGALDVEHAGPPLLVVLVVRDEREDLGPGLLDDDAVLCRWHADEITPRRVRVRNPADRTAGGPRASPPRRSA